MRLRSTRLTAIAAAVQQLITSYAPDSLFANAETGVWFDPSDIVLGWRYNLYTYTEQFDNAAWGKTRTIIQTNQITAPDGTQTADKLIANTDNSSHYLVRTYASTGTNVFSIYAKAGEYSRIMLRDDINPATQTVVFDLLTGTIISGPNGTIESVGDGWYRCTRTAITNINNNPGVFILVAPATATVYADAFYAGNGTNGVYIWGAQVVDQSFADKPYQRIIDGIADYYNYKEQPIMFQDAGGTIPVTAVEQPVGLILDKRRGLILGTELTSGSWSNSTTIPFDSFNAINNGFTATKSVSGSQQQAAIGSFSITAGSFYYFELQISANTFANTQLSVNLATGTTLRSTANVVIPTGTSIVRGYLVASSSQAAASLRISSLSTNIGSITVTRVSVRELPGAHGSQTNGPSRPVFSARLNLIIKTQEFADSAWAITNVSVVSNVSATNDPIGGKTADLIYPLSTGNNRHIFQGTGQPGNQKFVRSVFAKAAGKSILYIDIEGGGTKQAFFDIAAGTLGTVASGYNSEIKSIGDGWFKCTVTTASEINTNFYGGIYGVADTINSTEVTANGLDGIYIWGASMVSINYSQLPYQRVNTATDYDTDLKFPRYIKFDGVDDFLSTAIIVPNTNKAQVFAGVRNNNTSVGVLIENSTTSSNGTSGSLAIYSRSAANGDYAFAANLGATYGYRQTANSWGFPSNNLLSVIYDGSTAGITNAIKPQINGADIPLIVVGTTAVGGFTANPLFIGRRTGSSLPFNGYVYQLIVRFGPNLTPDEITSTQNWVNERAKIY